MKVHQLVANFLCLPTHPGGLVNDAYLTQGKSELTITCICSVSFLHCILNYVRTALLFNLKYVLSFSLTK